MFDIAARKARPMRKGTKVLWASLLRGAMAGDAGLTASGLKNTREAGLRAELGWYPLETDVRKLKCRHRTRSISRRDCQAQLIGPYGRK